MFNSTESRRDNFLSRVFGIFSEEVIRTWAACPEATYRDLGRPTVQSPGTGRGYTLDFALVDRNTGGVYVAVQKCEIAYGNYQYLRLEGPEQVVHHGGDKHSSGSCQ